MRGMVQFLNLYNQYREKQKQVQFVLVYIKEAHADDEWFRLIGNQSINHHESLNDRFEAFKQMYANIEQLINDNECDMKSIEDVKKMKFILDSMDKVKNLDGLFNAWPERIVALKNYRVVHRFGGPGPVATIVNKKYDVKELEIYLREYFQNE